MQNTTVLVGNSSMVSDSMRDNPLMQYYAAVYTMSMVIMLLLKLLRGVIFVKVRFTRDYKIYKVFICPLIS